MNQHSALRGVSTRSTPQSEPIPGASQVPNSAGGYGWKVDRWGRLQRFLVLGTAGGTFYINESKLTRENADVVLECIKIDGPQTVKAIVDVSESGRAPKNDPALFALAMCAKLGDLNTRKAAFEALPRVARIGTHLFHFATYVEQFGGWGRGLRNAVAAWYGRDVATVAYQAVKYRQRDGWSHRDLLRLAHPRPADREHDALFHWIVDRDDILEKTDGHPIADPEGMLLIVEGYEKAQVAQSPEDTANVLRGYPNLPREALNPEHLTSPEVWAQMLDNGMPMTAMIRNLGNMTRIGLLTPTSDATVQIVNALADGDVIRKARVHPIAVLAAMVTYASGGGLRSRNTWSPVASVVDALDGAFYEAFGNVEPTGKRILFGLDVSSSMDGHRCAGIEALSARVATAALALVTASVEQRYETIAFTAGGSRSSFDYRYSRRREVTPFALSPRQRLDDVVINMSSLPFGGTDCALPMTYATENDREVDLFVVLTDNETWAGGIHPSQALVKYRQHSGIADAKLVVVGMASNGFSIADPADPGMLDVVGMDTATPNVISGFARGEV